jgi:peptidoglycan/LPS O-acetylase OafA/YrhL
VPAVNPNLEGEDESPRVISPFAQTTSTVQAKGGKSSGSYALWIVSGLLILVIVGIIGYFTYKYLDDPFRTLKPFPMDKYLSDYRSMTGLKFRERAKLFGLDGGRRRRPCLCRFM